MRTTLQHVSELTSYVNEVLIPDWLEHEPDQQEINDMIDVVRKAQRSVDLALHQLVISVS